MDRLNGRGSPLLKIDYNVEIICASRKETVETLEEVEDDDSTEAFPDIEEQEFCTSIMID